MIGPSTGQLRLPRGQLRLEKACDLVEDADDAIAAWAHVIDIVQWRPMVLPLLYFAAVWV